ncbi:type II toxin-antitoxin system RelE/ParE family toxin [Pseudaminobacter sp. 19-2017]|uniref:Type II toxin-antitoxin system RelE/ParE family toxin n=1 Tax=Pseudaminobacter soli (ex Zhang et al. 2022) TaxID=2831468 RepID=A0A942E1E7_9HYPH|nr:type II toxin-antitoxin system RelE/ParE family toxin [Pseudaminobacter soli]
MKVRWSTAANRHLDEIVEYIAFDSPAAALRMDDLLRDAARRLADFPNLGKPGAIAGTRELIPHRSYRIVYEIDDDLVRILAVVHTSRLWPPFSGEDD